jgi:hypothetical protein
MGKRDDVLALAKALCPETWICGDNFAALF